MQTVRNRVADILGIDLPIVQAPMNYIAGHALAAAVSAAGGMGVLGPNAGKVQGEEISMRERTLREFARIREVTDKPVGINVVVPDGENKAALMYAAARWKRQPRVEQRQHFAWADCSQRFLNSSKKRA